MPVMVIWVELIGTSFLSKSLDSSVIIEPVSNKSSIRRIVISIRREICADSRPASNEIFG